MPKMNREEREAFLADLHVGILSVAEPGRGPLTAPIWYGYEPGGDVWFVVEPDSRKGRLLTEGIRVSLCAQTEDPPYKYASVEGPVTSIRPSEADQSSEPLAIRYLGPDLGKRYAESMRGGKSVTVRMRPERWLTTDYSKGM